MAYKPVKVPQKEISSVDITSAAGGLYTGGDQNAPVNCFVKSKDSELTHDGYLIPRRKLIPILPDTVGVAYQKFPVLWEGLLYIFTVDDGKVKWTTLFGSEWTDCDGANDVTTNNGGMPKLIRVLDKVLIINGKNGDRLCFVDLTIADWPVVKYDPVADPTVVPTAALTNISSGALDIFYAYNYNGNIGMTELSPIATVSINRPRDMWQTGTAGSLELTRTGSIPANAQSWNVFIALASTTGTIQPSDMLMIAGGLDLGTDKFIDDGSLDINLGAVAPEVNSTEGPRVDQGIVEDGTPVLFADQDNLYNIWIGGGGQYALDFSTNNGGYRAEPQRGTNYYPTTIVGFRTGQGVPALTVLYSNTEGLSKQAVLQQQTVNYGNASFTVWGVTEQHYGAAGVAAPNSAINYNGKLLFLSTAGFMSMETQPTVQNVLSTHGVDRPIRDFVKSIKNSAMPSVIGAGWDNKYMWLVPSLGFDDPQQILVLDTNSKGVEENGAWYTLNIKAQWIGTISPPDGPAFVYVSQGNKTFMLTEGSSTFDVVGGVNVPFSTSARGALTGVSGVAHNTWMADVQAMFYVLGLVGGMWIGVTYRNLNGRLKTKRKFIQGPSFNPSAAGGYGDPGWIYAYGPMVPGYAGTPYIDDSAVSVSSKDVRVPVRIDDIHNEAQWFYSTEVGYNDFKFKAVSYEGINLGVRPDLQ